MISLLKGGFFHILTGSAFSKAIATISSIIVARIIDKVAYANYSYANNIYSYITLLAGLGLSSSILKYCSATSDKRVEKAYMRYAFYVGGSLFIRLCLTMLEMNFIVY